MKKAKVKKPRNKQLQIKAEKIWKEICLLRDGRECQVKKNFPELNISHSEIIQVDHLIERGWKRTFVEIANGTVVCSYCNSNKRYNSAIAKAIETIRRNREGDDVIDLMFEERGRGTAFVEWSRVGWLEDKIDVLENIRDNLKRGVYV